MSYVVTIPFDDSEEAAGFLLTLDKECFHNSRLFRSDEVTLGPQLNLGNLVGVGEIAERCGVSLSTVSNWIKRYPRFPTPLVELKMGKLWNWPSIESWLRDRPDTRSVGPRIKL